MTSSSSRVSTRRRGADWSALFGARLPAPGLANTILPGDLGALLSAFDQLRSIDQPEGMLRRTVEIARQLGLHRAAIFLFDRHRNAMTGTWGSDRAGRIVDESHLAHPASDATREALRRAEEEDAPVTVFENIAVPEQRGPAAPAGRGWVAYTPIRSARGSLGILVNDGGLGAAPVDEEKQAQAAIVCAFLGTLLDPIRALIVGGRAVMKDSYGRIVSAALGMLAEDPSLGGKQIAGHLNISLSRLARVFKAQVGMSMVEYRNRLRLDRFATLLDEGRPTLQGTALEAGFGSYAQFHRVFRALRGSAPRQMLRANS